MIPLVEAIEQGRAQFENRFARDDLYFMFLLPVSTLS